MERLPQVHILAMPYPALGHVLPLMELSHCLVKDGHFRITFVNTEFNHQRLENKEQIGDSINLVSIPDGMEPWEDRNDIGKLTESLLTVAPRKLEELICAFGDGDDKVTCIIADQFLGWVFELAEKMKIRRVAFWPASAAMLTQVFHVDKFIEDGFIDSNGTPLKIHQEIQLAPTMPSMSATNFLWLCFFGETTKRIMFDAINKNNKTTNIIDRIICNSAYDLEPGAFTLVPKMQPIGPLLASTRKGNSSGSFWQEDTNCLKWLEQHPLKSVIYVAFGSFTIFDKTQFQELALGLELTGKPFLWVVRPGTTKANTNVYPQGFEERVASRGKIVEWAPQQNVLSHPSVGCFLSHCGWNSTMEGVANGVPFLCWPYFADQVLNQSYLCDVWKVGLSFNHGEFGIINRDEIRNKVEQVLRDENIKARVKEVKELAIKSVGEYGHSNKIFSDFVEWLKEC